MDFMTLVKEILSDLLNGVFSARLLVVIWMGGLLVAGAILFLFGERAGRLSNWKPVRGWQNEIGIWNIAMTMVLGGVLQSGTKNEAYVLPGLVVMALGFSINHAFSMIKSKSMPLTHLAAVIANMSGVLLTTTYYFIG